MVCLYLDDKVVHNEGAARAHGQMSEEERLPKQVVDSDTPHLVTEADEAAIAALRRQKIEVVLR